MKYALVTGGSGGIGSAICYRLSTIGFSVLIHYNTNLASATKTLDKINVNGGNGELIRFDIKDNRKKSCNYKKAYERYCRIKHCIIWPFGY